MNNKNCFILIILCLFTSLGKAQFQMSSDPLRTSPAFAGSKSAGRVAGTFLIGQRAIVNNYERDDSYLYLSYDNFIKAIKSGLGVYLKSGHVHNEIPGIEHYQFNHSTVGLCLAPKLSTAAHLPSATLSPSVGLEYIHYQLKYGTNIQTNEAAKSQIGLRTGLLYNNSKSYAGIALKYLSSNGRHLVFTSLHGGYTFQKKISSKFSFAPTFNLLYIDAFGRKDPESPAENYFYIDALNLNFRYNKILFGTGIPNIMVGIQTKKIKAMICYNIGLVKVNNFYDGQTSLKSAQVSIVYTGTGKQK